MIKHIVVWKLKDEALGATKAENAARIAREVADLAGIVPGLRHIECGASIEPSAAWDIGLYSEFDSTAALEAYQAHPQHQALKEFIASLTASQALIETGDAEQFCREFRQISEWFGPFCEQALRESSFLIDKLVERF